MPDELTDGQIALPCEIGELHLPELMDDQKRALERLVSQGYVKAAENHARVAAENRSSTMPPYCPGGTTATRGAV